MKKWELTGRESVNLAFSKQPGEKPQSMETTTVVPSRKKESSAVERIS
jgi:hypothetical protein